MASKKTKVKFLRSAEVKKFLLALHSFFEQQVSEPKVAIKSIVTGDLTLYATKADQVLAFQYEGFPLLPSLQLIKSHRSTLLLETATVDVGAIRFVLNGADIMAPGITQFSNSLTSGTPVVILEERGQEPIAVGQLLRPTDEIISQKKGKAIKNLHYLGDLIWKYPDWS